MRVGRFHIGIRSSTLELDQRVRQLLAAHLVDDDGARPNYSIQVGGPLAEERGTTRLHLLYEGTCVAARGKVLDDVMLGLLHRLARHGEHEDGFLHVHATALRQPDGRVVLVPHDLHDALVSQARRFQQRDMELLDSVIWALDPSTASISAAATDLTPDLTALDSAVADRWHPPDAFAIERWLVRSDGAPLGRLSPGESLLATSQTVTNAADRGQPAATEELAAAVRQISVHATGQSSPREIVSALLDGDDLLQA